MGKLANYIFIIIGLMVLFRVAGLITSGVTLTDYGLGSIIGITNLQDFSFFQFLEDNWITLSAAIAGIIVGILGKSSAFQTLSAAIVIGILGAFITDLISIANKVNEAGGFIGWLAILLMAPIIYVYILAAWEWIGGKD